MEFDNQFTVRAPLDQVWTFMQNAQEVAPCVPGAAITDIIDHTHYRGTAKIKVGPVQMLYRGDLEMEPDEAQHVITLRAKGSEARGGGGASGTVTTRLTSTTDGGTQVDIHSQVDVSGRAAQFGRGLMQDVATKLIKDFAQCLQRKIEAERQEVTEAPAAYVENGPPEGSIPIPTPPPESAATITPGQVEGAPLLDPADAMRTGELPTSSTSPTQMQPPAAMARPPTAPFPTSNSSPGGELSLTSLVGSVLRTRAARLLRDLADRLEQ